MRASTEHDIGHLRWDYPLVASRTVDKKYYITSPNTDFIPEPFVGRVVVAMRADYRYGPPDPIQWPQVLSENFEYLCAILRRVPPTDPRAPIWSDPLDSEFKLIKGCEFKSLGLFGKSWLEPLSALVAQLSRRIANRPGTPSARLLWLDTAMQQACDRLQRFPSTFWDACIQVRETQRYWLMATAFLEYHDTLATCSLDKARPVRQELMGAFTTHAPAVQQLYAAGIPVWFIRTDASVVGLHLNTCPLTPPLSITTAWGPGGGYELYTGLSGPRHLQCTARGGHTYIDVSHAPLLAVYEDAGYAPPASQRSSRSTTGLSGASSNRGPVRTPTSIRGAASTGSPLSTRHAASTSEL